MPAGPTLRERQAGLVWAQNVCILLFHAVCSLCELGVSYTLPDQLNLSPSDLDSAL